MVFEVMGSLGISKVAATKVVNSIDAAGWAFIVGGAALAVTTGGALTAASISADVMILTVKEYIKRNLKAQAIVY